MIIAGIPFALAVLHVISTVLFSNESIYEIEVGENGQTMDVALKISFIPFAIALAYWGYEKFFKSK